MASPGAPAAPPAPRVIDCGANIGISVLACKLAHPASRIVAFEPVPELFAVLRRNLERNRVEGVEAIEAAVAAREGEVELHVDARGLETLIASARPERLAAPRKLAVKAVRLADYLTEPADFLKLDIEGGESEVIADLARSGALERVERLAIEYHHHLGSDPDALGGFLRVLEQAGFGYQLASTIRDPEAEGRFQDVLVRAYRRRPDPGR